MSEIKVDTLTGKTTAGNITVTSEGGAATMQLQQTLVKSWITIEQVAPTVLDSFAITSIVDNSTGDMELNLTNNFTNDDYVVTGALGNDNGSKSTSPTYFRGHTWQTNAYKFMSFYSGGVAEWNNTSLQFVGGLA